MDAYLLQLTDIVRTYDALGRGDKTKYLAREAERLNRAPQTLLG